jgi:hypothetical protein
MDRWVAELNGAVPFTAGDHGYALAAADGLSERGFFRVSRFGLDPIDFHDTDHFRIVRDFCSDPQTFMEEVAG